MIDPYVYEKLRTFAERDLEKRQEMMLLRAQVPPRGPTVRPIIRFAGVALHRLGERLECWGTPVCPDLEAEPVRVRRA